MYCRKNKKTGLSLEAKMTILYNNFIEAIDEFKKEIKTNANATVAQVPVPAINNFREIVVNAYQKRVIVRSAEAWHNLKHECVSAEEWADLKEQIESAENLSTKQKQIIINTP